MHIIIGLGSNLGDRARNIHRAIELITSMNIGRLIATSHLYETEPVGPPQPNFINAAIRIDTPNDIQSVMRNLLEVERTMGRTRRERWGPRIIDLDILWTSGEKIDLPNLRVPHPELTKRTFALAPLLDVGPDLMPMYGPILELLGGSPPII